MADKKELIALFQNRNKYDLDVFLDEHWAMYYKQYYIKHTPPRAPDEAHLYEIKRPPKKTGQPNKYIFATTSRQEAKNIIDKDFEEWFSAEDFDDYDVTASPPKKRGRKKKKL